MAGAWIKVEHVTPDKPELVAMSARLGIDQDAVFGKCMRLWIWADQQSVSGNDLSVTPMFIDRLTNCPGFSDALIEAGWLKSRSGRFSIPHFDRHNGQTAKARALTKDRVKRSRNGGCVTETVNPLSLISTSPSLSDSSSVSEGGLGETEPELPPELGTTPFRAAWSEWVAYRKQARLKAYTAIGMGKQLKRLAEMGHDRSIAAIEHSIANGFQGIYEDRNRNGRGAGEHRGKRAEREHAEPTLKLRQI